MKVDVIYQKSSQRMTELPDESIDMSLTSPPYWGLRDYGDDVKEIWGGDEDCEHEFNSLLPGHHPGQVPQTKKQVASGSKNSGQFCQKCHAWHGQLGLEPTFQLYLDHMMIVCTEIKRVLKKTGSFWLNMGDTYAGGGGGNYGTGLSVVQKDKGLAHLTNVRNRENWLRENRLQPKCLIGIPWRLVLRLIDEQGWILRNAGIWNKPNSMPSSTKDRLSNSYEFLFHLVKNTKPQYYWNEKTGLMADRKPKELKEGIDWEWRECSRCLGKGKIEEKICLRCKGIGKIKHSFWHSLGYWYDLDAIREEWTDKRKSDIKRAREKHPGYSGKYGLGYNIERRAILPGQGIKGQPVGNPDSGKNPGDVWTIPTQPRPEAHFACVDMQTEALTKNGWRNADELTFQDKIATFNYLNEKVIYHKPYNIFRFPFDGELITIENQWISQFVTPNHRVLLKYIHARDRNEADHIWHFEQADTLRPFNGILIPNAGKYDGQYLLGKEKAELLGWLITEGCITKDKRITIYQSLSANPEKVRRIEELLNLLNIDYSRADRKRRKSRVNGREYISDETSFYIKKRGVNWQWIFDWIDDDKMPSWKLLHLRPKDLRALYEGIIAGNGHRRSDGREAFVQNNDYIRSWFRVLCLHLNLRTTEYKCTRISKRGTVYVTQQNCSQIHSSDFKECVSKKFYKGMVWCPHVPNGAWVARRRGKVFITGNTFPDKLCIKPILATCPAEICKKCGKARVRIIKTDNPSEKLLEWDKIRKSGLPGSIRIRQSIKSLHRNVSPDGKTKGVYYSGQTIGWTDCGCNAGWDSGVLLDPFGGQGTSAVMAKKMGRHYIVYELKKEYCEKLIRPALEEIDPLFNWKTPSPVAG